MEGKLASTTNGFDALKLNEAALQRDALKPVLLERSVSLTINSDRKIPAIFVDEPKEEMEKAVCDKIVDSALQDGKQAKDDASNLLPLVVESSPAKTVARSIYSG